ncbi:MAG: trypsin-like peptidase domain-containing protein [Deltaproteobacteria bacterium]|nr:trypsin-like peptidase domain-containing protein [Deltaproteobacteria bacterium]
MSRFLRANLSGAPVALAVIVGASLWFGACASGLAPHLAEAEPLGVTPAVASAAVTPEPAAPAPVAPRSLADVVGAALPAVVLIVNEHGDGTMTYGAGFVIEHGRVLTSLHVVRGEGAIYAMPYRAGRATYTPMDGGLSRFLFENQSELIQAAVFAQDGVTDLAILTLDADTSGFPQLPWAAEPIRPGERVVALGHPQETAWSFSEGVVGALQYGIIQHDAVVGPGSSGGPLLNMRGEVVGVNVAHIINRPLGLSFARPMAMVAASFGSRLGAEVVDKSSPEGTALSCWRAQELGLPDAADCFDWEAEWHAHLLLLDEAQRAATSGLVRDRIEACGKSAKAKEAWLEKRREHVVHALDPEHAATRAKLQQKELDPRDKDLPPVVGKALAKAIATMKAAEAEKGSLEGDYREPRRLRSRLHLGLRVEGVQHIGPRLAWVLLASRNADGTVARFPELYAKVGDEWRQRGFPLPEEVAQLPDGWPEPLLTYAMQRPFGIAWILKRAASTDACGGS